MYLRKNLKIISGIALLSLFSCTHKTDLTNVRTVSFKSEVLPIFQTNCAMCHGKDKQEAELDVTTYNGIMKGVTSGIANKSDIYNAITSAIAIMPPAPHEVLNQDQRSLVYVWIEQGAKNN